MLSGSFRTFSEKEGFGTDTSDAIHERRFCKSSHPQTVVHIPAVAESTAGRLSFLEDGILGRYTQSGRTLSANNKSKE